LQGGVTQVSIRCRPCTKAGTHTPRHRLGQAGRRLSPNNRGLWLWAPACRLRQGFGGPRS